MKRFIAIVLSLVLICALFVGCEGSDKELKKIRVNEVTHSIFYTPFYLAIELGYFEDEGIEIELTNGGGSNVSMTAIVSGQADIALVGPETAIYVYNEGRSDFPLVFAQLTKRDGSFLVSKKAEPNFKYSDLTGKEILAGRKGGLPAMTLQYVLNNNGLINGENVTLNYDIAFNMMAGAFEGGQGDYTTLFEPTASDFCKAGKGHIVASIGKDSGEVPYTCFVATQSYIKENPDNIEGFLRAIYRARKYLQETASAEVAKVLLPQFASTSEENIRLTLESYLEIDAWMTNMAMTEDSFIRLQDIMANAGELKSRVQYTKLIYNDLAQKIYSEIYQN